MLALSYHSAGAASYVVYARVSRSCTKIMASVGSAGYAICGAQHLLPAQRWSPTIRLFKVLFTMCYMVNMSSSLHMVNA